MMMLIGNKVFGQSGEEFTVIEGIGHGGFGHVFKVQDVQGDRNIYALKIANADGMTDSEYKALVNEAVTATGIDHHNVSKIHYFHDGKKYPDLSPYLLMDFANGGDLRQFINKQSEFLEAEVLLDVTKQICRGMQAVNEKLVHRDLHPGNILLNDSVIKITDFGLSKVVDAATRTQTFKGITHLMYKSPESWKNQTNTVQMDMYSVGLTLYELATLKYPYIFPMKKENLLEIQDAHLYGSFVPANQINNKIPSALNEVINKLLKKRPLDRFNSWSEALQLLDTADKISNQGLDISSLVAKAAATDMETERRVSEGNRLEQEREEKTMGLKYMVLAIAQEVEKLVEAFNVQTVRDTLIFKNNFEGRGFTVTSSKTRGSLVCRCSESGTITRKVQNMFSGGYTEVPDVLKFRDKKVEFWGHIVNSKDRGINLLLIKENDQDLYGKWMILKNSWSIFARDRSSHPVEPFALTDWDAFTKRTQLLGATDIMQTEVREFVLDEIKWIIEDML